MIDKEKTFSPSLVEKGRSMTQGPIRRWNFFGFRLKVMSMRRSCRGRLTG
jgi:hypothetical protein